MTSEVIDESDGCGAKFNVVIVSDKFDGKSLIQRHSVLPPLTYFAESNMATETLIECTSSTKPLCFGISAPGKIILFGEHSVVYRRPAVAASIDRRTSLRFIEQVGRNVSFKFPSVRLEHSFSIDDISAILAVPIPLLSGNEGLYSLSKPQSIDHDALVRGIYEAVGEATLSLFSTPQQLSLIAVMYAMCGMLGSVGIGVHPFSIEMSTQLVIGAGTGSSASFACCLAAAFFHYIRVKGLANQTRGSNAVNVSKTGIDPFSIDCGCDLSTFTQMEKMIINEWAFNLERLMHGKPSGLDNTVCTFGSVIQMDASDTHQPISMLGNVEQLQILLVNTRVCRNTSNLVKKVSSLRDHHFAIVEHMLDAMGEIAKSAVTVIRDLAINLHCEESTQNNFKCLEDLIDMNHCLLSALGVSHPSLEEIRRISNMCGLNGKITGAGGGGYAFILVPPTCIAAKMAECSELLQQAGFETLNIKLGVNGVQVETADA